MATRASRPFHFLTGAGVGVVFLLLGLDQRADAASDSERLGAQLFIGGGVAFIALVLVGLYVNARSRVWLDDDGIGWYRLFRFRHVPWFDVEEVELFQRRQPLAGSNRRHGLISYYLRLGFNTDSGQKKKQLPLEHTSKADAERSARTIAGRSRFPIRVHEEQKRTLF